MQMYELQKKTFSSKSKISEVGPWELGLSLGSERQNSTRLAKHKQTGQLAVVKPLLGWSQYTPSQQTSIESELVLLRLIEHPNVLQLIDVITQQDQLYVVVEYMPGGELFDCMLRKGSFSEETAAKFLWQILYGLEYCHKLHICHRDLKPENLFLDAHGSIKIAEFGMASVQQPGKLLQTSCGSPHYASPEIIMGRPYNGCASDIWSCGVILFALLTGRLPFDDDNIRSLLLKVCDGHFEMPSDISPQAQHLLYRMLDVNPSTRMTMEQIREHPFVSYLAKPNISIPIVSAPIQPVDPLIVQHLSLLFCCSENPMSLYESLASQSPLLEKTLYTLLSRHLHPPSTAAIDRNRAVVNDLLGTEAAKNYIVDEEDKNRNETEKVVQGPSSTLFPATYVADPISRPATSASPFFPSMASAGVKYPYTLNNQSSFFHRPATSTSAMPQIPKSVTPGLATQYSHIPPVIPSLRSTTNVQHPFAVPNSDPESSGNRRAVSLDMSNDFPGNESELQLKSGTPFSYVNGSGDMGPPKRRVVSRLSEYNNKTPMGYSAANSGNSKTARFQVLPDSTPSNENYAHNQPLTNPHYAASRRVRTPSGERMVPVDMVSSMGSYDYINVPKQRRQSLFTQSASQKKLSGSPFQPKRSFLRRLFSSEPSCKCIYASLSAAELEYEILEVLRRWQLLGVGIADIFYDAVSVSISARIKRQNSLNLKGLRFRVSVLTEYFGSQAVFVLESGSSSTFDHLATEFQLIFEDKGFIDNLEPSYFQSVAPRPSSRFSVTNSPFAAFRQRQSIQS
ncbi:CAMK/CAMKL/GIN4 protein kinase Cdr2 [Schizosaccharomyces cryophilus OY26]|uniref:non-specific serine/threonine protein kinase n=1 Tax=Schizosaccharomyces cryophilus (strain OY26 / ATCC MYA-4695 / CBS 11777 / NBRC 106824 / NRRL Y48691) TaxID=653667 RepID=S9XB04_SCHCR|nr:CAMK/CAMKL/GIN4 protein kinase Cdr2 [Schizosaccharomyces cryophilus OY26]EPY50926.1 CAMK/CAMKL/GIN4 protein kinase Cdr2 [Schizosaccharomyces cryophilus OY26]